MIRGEPFNRLRRARVVLACQGQHSPNRVITFDGELHRKRLLRLVPAPQRKLWGALLLRIGNWSLIRGLVH